MTRVIRLFQKSPAYILRRIWQEAKSESDYFLRSVHRKRASRRFICARLSETTIADAWTTLAARPFPFIPSLTDLNKFPDMVPIEYARLLAAARRGLNNQVDLLGSGPISLGETIDWSKDYKTGISWPKKYMRHIDYNNPERPSDVKFPWELSRLQWLLPLGQAYLLTDEEPYAEHTKKLLESWISENPFSYSVNWSCTMEVAIRSMTLIWLFYAMSKSKAWDDEDFQFAFLQTLWLHAQFIRRHIERGDVNGNHYTADACAMVFCGIFWRDKAGRSDLEAEGWAILQEEMELQVCDDGVDFEMSVPYHRLVQEFFLFPAIYREAAGSDVSDNYKSKLKKMARFTAAYSRPDGTSPHWGDADDARALPLGFQDIGDHRYLCDICADFLGEPIAPPGDPNEVSEVFWICGAEQADQVLNRENKNVFRSQAYPTGGVYIMQDRNNHIMIDCGPVGLAGRGGHGHNDILSFEAVLAGIYLIADRGSFVYTADFKARNDFRSTASHNTPQIDRIELNRFISDDNLWQLRYDALPNVLKWNVGADADVFEGSHSGYEKLDSPVTPIRTISLEHAKCRLVIEDRFIGSGHHRTRIPYHLAPGVNVEIEPDKSILLTRGDSEFRMEWEPKVDWQSSIADTFVSPSYGVRQRSKVIWFERDGPLKPLKVTISPVIG